MGKKIPGHKYIRPALAYFSSDKEKSDFINNAIVRQTDIQQHEGHDGDKDKMPEGVLPDLIGRHGLRQSQQNKIQKIRIKKKNKIKQMKLKLKSLMLN